LFLGPSDQSDIYKTEKEEMFGIVKEILLIDLRTAVVISSAVINYSTIVPPPVLQELCMFSPTR